MFQGTVIDDRPSSSADDRRERHDHDRVVERDLGQGEMRLAVDEVRPDEHHGRAGRGRQQDQPGDIAVDLIGGQQRPEQMADEQPAEQRHRERLDQPVDRRPSRRCRANAARTSSKRREIDLEQHRDDHQPDQHRDRQIDLRDRCGAERMEDARQQPARGAMPAMMQSATQSVRKRSNMPMAALCWVSATAAVSLMAWASLLRLP